MKLSVLSLTKCIFWKHLFCILDVSDVPVVCIRLMPANMNLYALQGF